MTKEELAALLNNRQMGDEIHQAEEAQALKAGLVVVFGYSDDCIELRGAINDEWGAGEGKQIPISTTGIEYVSEEEAEVLEKFGVLKVVEARRAIITTRWGCDDYSWLYETTIPHATFDILEDEEKFCRGIVFSLADIKG